MSDVVDVLHAAGVAGFVYDPATDPPVAVVHGGDHPGGSTTWWASCRPCWWWSEDDHPNANPIFDPAGAQVLADEHNRLHHQGARHMKRRCPECGRTFDLTDEGDADEFHNGHDCEAP